MTKLNMKSNASKSRKSSTRVVVRDIVLKTILNDIIHDDKSRTLTTKQMRVVLRREFAQSMQHARNNAWTFTQNEYDIVRSRFDAKYRAKIERTTKRNASKIAKSNNVAIVVDANA